MLYTRKNILLLFNNSDIWSRFIHILELEGYNVFWAANIEEAKGLVDKFNVDLIFCDIPLTFDGNAYDINQVSLVSDLDADIPKLVGVAFFARISELQPSLPNTYFFNLNLGPEAALNEIRDLLDKYNFLSNLRIAVNDQSRELIVLESTLSNLPDPAINALNAAAIPHWFDYPFLEAMLGEEAAEEGYEDLFDLTFVEDFPGRGYAIHEATRHALLYKLWQADPHQFRTLSQKAADYCAKQAGDGYEANQWRSEEIYHQLVANPEVGFERFQKMSTAWANYEQSSLEQIERLTQLAREQVKSGRLSAAENNLVRYWQARLALLYGRTAKAAEYIGKVAILPSTDPHFAADLADLRGDIYAAQNNLNTAKQAWLNASDLYQQNGRSFDQYLVREKLRTHNLLDDQPEETSATPNPPDKLTLQLLNNIEDAWINGVLKEVFKDGKQSLDLPKARGSDSLLSGRLRVRRADGLDQKVSDSGLSGLFEASGRSLLILGAPGSGKTITLLELLDELIQKARHSRTAPVPLFFNLSSFSKFKGSFLEWLAEQAYLQYRLNREVTKDQIQSGQRFILLLDGLDEMTSDLDGLSAHVTNINAFISENLCGFAFCSRISDLIQLDSPLSVKHAVILQPLNNQQIQAIIPENMQELFISHWQFREAVRSPLLMGLLPKAFPTEITQIHQIPDSIDGWEQTILHHYASNILPPSERGSPEIWLAFLAKNLKRKGTSIFDLENLQPAWLQFRTQHRQFMSIAGLILGLILGLIFVLIMGLREDLWAWAGVVAISGVSGAFGGWSSQLLQSSLKQAVLGVLVSIAISISSIFVILGNEFSSATLFGVSLGLIFGTGIFISFFLLFQSSSIMPRDKLVLQKPTKSVLIKNINYFCLIGLFFGVLIGVVNRLGFDYLAILRDGSIGAISGAIIGVLFGTSISVLSAPSIDKRSAPNQGIQNSLRTSLMMMSAIVIGTILVEWLLRALLDFASETSFYFSTAFAWFLPIVFTYYGGMAWCKHWALRFILYWYSYLPFPLAPWLNTMVKVGLMRRVGGGYIFLHRSLLEYFANLDQETE